LIVLLSAALPAILVVVVHYPAMMMTDRECIDLDQCAPVALAVICVMLDEGLMVMALVVPWLLKGEYRQHRLLDNELPASFFKWLVTVDARVQRGSSETSLRIVKVVIHPRELETWARHAGCHVNEQARSDYAELMWRLEADRSRAGGGRAPFGTLVKHHPMSSHPGVSNDS
jgi:hypothetical protein